MQKKQTATKNILFTFAALAFFLGGVAVFNYTVDPMCYYRCEAIDLGRMTQNVYYRSAQTAAANTDAEVIVVGSSRGERVPPRWVESVTGLKTVNLSQGGADLFLKVALVNIALENAPIKKVIWMADHFELVPSSTDIKTRQTPILQKYSGIKDSGALSRWAFLEPLQALIDHRTFEAALDMSRRDYNEVFLKDGNGSEIDFAKCLEAGFVGPTPPEMMQKKIDESYPLLANTRLQTQDPAYWDVFEKHIRALSAKGVQVIINIAPFHSKLMARLYQESPDAKERLEAWTARLEKLSNANVTVLHNELGIPGDDGGPRFWEDGAHPTCFGAIEMLRGALLKK